MGPDVPIFAASTGGPMTSTLLDTPSAASPPEFGLNLTPYSLRHVFATNFLRGGGNALELTAHPRPQQHADDHPVRQPEPGGPPRGPPARLPGQRLVPGGSGAHPGSSRSDAASTPPRPALSPRSHVEPREPLLSPGRVRTPPGPREGPSGASWKGGGEQRGGSGARSEEGAAREGREGRRSHDHQRRKQQAHTDSPP